MSLILSVNCGSSSIKFQVFTSPSPSSPEDAFNVILSGSASSVQSSSSPAKFKYTYLPTSSSDSKELSSETAYVDVFTEILKQVQRVLEENGEKEIKLIAHRIVHGGTEREALVVPHGGKGEEEVLERMDKVSDFAPLHNHHAMLIVKACLHSLPTATSVLCFDTLFHASLPAHIYTYALSSPPHPTPVPLRKYGFHGLSYQSILTQMSRNLGKEEKDVNIVVAHLGSGGSCCLIQGGKSMDTSMGVTPLEGLPGGTRSGTIDPSIIFHHTKDCSETVDWSGRQITRAEYVMNKESGFQALCGTNDFGEITEKMKSASSEGKFVVAYELYLSHLHAYLSAYISTLLSSSAPHNTLDALVFSGGIGEHSVELRRDVLAKFEWIEKLAGGGGGIDRKSNEEGKGGRRITKEGSKIEAWVVETDEEVVSAQMAWKASGGK